MTKYREIIRLQSLMISERTIAESCGVSRNTVSKVLKKAKELKISWPLGPEMTDARLGELLSLRLKRQPIKGCRIMITSERNCSVTE